MEPPLKANPPYKIGPEIRYPPLKKLPAVKMFAQVFKYDLNQKLATEIVPINKKHELMCSISAKQPEKCGKNKKV